MSDAGEESKLHRHARKFFACTNPGKVLRRYASRADSMKKHELLQHMSHVCAWVALARPPTRAVEFFETRDGPMSPVTVLLGMLQRRGRLRLDERSQAALDAVRSTCDVVLQTTQKLCESSREHWAALHKHLPKRRLATLDSKQSKQRRTTLDSNDTDTKEAETAGISVTADVSMFKRVKKLNDSIVKWHNRDLVEAERVITALELQLSDIINTKCIGDIDTIALRKVMFATIGALANPRAKAQSQANLALMSDDDIMRLKKTSDLQKRMRKILLRGIALWRNFLLLEDAQIEPLLEYLRTSICEFEGMHGSVTVACAANQWQRIKDMIDKPKEDAQLDQDYSAIVSTEGESHSTKIRWSDEHLEQVKNAVERRGGKSMLTLSLWSDIAAEVGRSVTATQKAYRRLTDPRYAPLPKQKKRNTPGMLKKLMNAAMTKLGGEATTDEILHCCRTDLDIQCEFGSKLVRTPSRGSGGTKQQESWEISVRNSVGLHFNRKGVKKGGKRVYVSKAS